MSKEKPIHPEAIQFQQIIDKLKPELAQLKSMPKTPEVRKKIQKTQDRINRNYAYIEDLNRIAKFKVH